MFVVLKQECLNNVDFTLHVQDMDYEECAVMTFWDIIIEYINDDDVLYLKEVSDKWIRTKFRAYETLRNFSLVSMRYVMNISQNVISRNRIGKI